MRPVPRRGTLKDKFALALTPAADSDFPICLTCMFSHWKNARRHKENVQTPHRQAPENIYTKTQKKHSNERHNLQRTPSRFRSWRRQYFNIVCLILFHNAISRTRVLKLTQKRKKSKLLSGYKLESQYWAHSGLMRALKAVITSVIYLHIDKTKYYIKHKRFNI